MNTKQKVGTGIAIIAASLISLGDAKDAKAQYPAGCAPKQFTIMEQRTITYPVTTFQRETTMVPRTQWVPQTVMVPQTRVVPYTHFESQTIQQPVTYQRVDPRQRPRCDLGRGIEQFIEGALSVPGAILQGIFDPCCRPPRPTRPYCGPVCAPAPVPRIPYCAPTMAVPVVPVPPCGCR